MDGFLYTVGEDVGAAPDRAKLVALIAEGEKVVCGGVSSLEGSVGQELLGADGGHLHKLVGSGLSLAE